MTDLKTTAKAYHAAGLCALPASRVEKFPIPAVGKWGRFKDRQATATELDAFFANRADALCIICGQASGNLEIFDFDQHGKAFADWEILLEEKAPGLFEQLLVETTQSGGFHVAYRCEEPVNGNQKLAEQLDSDTGEIKTLIETRGQGGLVIAAPTEGYEILQGDWCKLPVLTPLQREKLLCCAKALSDTQIQEKTLSAKETANDFGRPGDDYNQRGDVRALLSTHGWQYLREDEKNEYWRRPGKLTGQHSATLRRDDLTFYVFSANAAPLLPGCAYSPFNLFAALQHNGDFNAAASELARQGFAAPKEEDVVDISGLLDTESPKEFYEIMDKIETENPQVHKPTIDKLLREGETMNVIAAPKVGKSWLILDLAIAAARGKSFIGKFDCPKQKVLLIDNELHDGTLMDRVKRIIKARNIPKEELRGQLFGKTLRGNQLDINGLGEFLGRQKPETFKMIILDAFYRFLPRGVNENSNADITMLYNLLDKHAQRLNCSFVLVHHTSKGNQAGKSITDVGSGAGAQSRATDTHLILRHHKQDGAIVLEAEVRSWTKVDPFCLRWDFPTWRVDYTLDPIDLKGSKNRRKSQKGPDVPFEEFLRHFFSSGKMIRQNDLLEQANQELGISKTKAGKFIEEALSTNWIYKHWPEGKNRACFLSRKAPEPEN